MRFILEVELDDLLAGGDAGKELGRILRFWGGAFPKLELAAGEGSAIYDSAYREVGRWRITDEPAPETGG